MDLSALLTGDGRCASCDARVTRDDARCTACGALQGDDEPTLSVLSQGPAAVDHPDYVPLEQSDNFIRFQMAASGIQNGAISPADYIAIVRGLRSVARIALERFASDAMQQQLARATEEEKATGQELHDAFQLWDEGLASMEAYAASGDPIDLTEGTRLAEMGFVAIDRIQVREIQRLP